MLFDRLRQYIRVGRLEVITPGGQVVSAGSPEAPHPIRVRVRRPEALARLTLNPDLALGEAYVDGDLVVENSDIFELLDLLGRNFSFDHRRRPRRSWWRRWPQLVNRWLNYWNDRTAAVSNVHHHYDLGLDFYSRWLDRSLQYSCAYFASPDLSLDEAQAAKVDLIAAKLNLQPGLSVLDIGCGFGGLALALAQREKVRVTGVTLAADPLEVARRRADETGLSNRVEFRFQDYRDVQGRFDRIVSVGMLEHVGLHHYQAFFDQVARLLDADGVALVHCIGRREPPGVTNPWIRKYIFPGGYIPALSEILPCVEKAGLWVTDVEILRLHYAMTLAHWRKRFNAHRGEIERRFDARFCRMWEFYLAVSETSFRHGGHMVFQLQLARKVDAVPLTRSYLRPALSAAEPASRPVPALATQPTP